MSEYRRYGTGVNEINYDFYDLDFDILLPQEVVERVAAGVDFCYHLVEVTAKFVYSYLFACGDEDAWRIFLCYPAVLELLKSVIYLLFRL